MCKYIGKAEATWGGILNMKSYAVKICCGGGGHLPYTIRYQPVLLVSSFQVLSILRWVLLYRWEVCARCNVVCTEQK